jgi:hypothetical protein
VALDHERSVKPEDLADEAAILVSVVDHDRVDSDVNADEIEPQVRYPFQTLSPVAPQCRLAMDDTIRAFEDPGGNGRRERCVLCEMAQHRVHVVRVPSF